MTAAPIDLHWVQQPGTRIGSVAAATSVDQAITMLAAQPELQPVAGGTDLVLELARSGAGGHAPLLDLTRITDFPALSFDDESHIVIGAGTTHADMLASVQARRALLPLVQACLEVGSAQLRNRATIVGNLVTASPANDTISALMALDAQVVTARLVNGQRAERTIALVDLYDGFRSTVLEAGELIHSILVPHPSPTQRGIWVKAGLRKAQAISVVHAGFVLDFADDGTVSSARVALGSVGPTVALSAPAAEALVGSALTDAVIRAAAEAAVGSVRPIDDGRATADYRSDSVHTVVSRALAALAADAQASRLPDTIPLLTNRQHRERVVAPAAVDGEISMQVNGEKLTAQSSGMGTLLDWLRDTAGTGTKEGCAEGECGACTVQLDGDAVMSCLVPAAQAHGSSVVTIEGLGTADEPNTMQQAFVDKFAVQCGYCIPGFVMAAQVLAEELGAVPTRDELELALAGNLCRCTGYYNIIEAVTVAVTQQLDRSKP